MVFLLKDEKIIADKLDCLRLRNAAQRTRCNEFYFLLVFYTFDTETGNFLCVESDLLFAHFITHILLFCYFLLIKRYAPLPGLFNIL